jgi:4-hydroxybenzoate polyprenyltransferase
MPEVRVPAIPNWVDWIVTLRLHHWPKCLVVLLGLLPTGAFRDPRSVCLVVAAAVLFQLVAAGGYLVNDVLDARRDRLHPRKRNRPIASGRISASSAASAALCLIATSTLVGWWLAPSFGLVLAGYAALSLAYSLWFKHFVAADILVIALIFVLRAVAGVWVIGAQVSPWFLASVGMLALLIALGKRLGEADSLRSAALAHRATLRAYQGPAWRLVLIAAAVATLGSYLLAAWASPTAHRHAWVLATSVPVAVGLWRYVQIVAAAGGGEPERLILRDRLLAACGLAWALMLAVAVLH